jgi:crotonobetainyl-CoA:carnitine CoA-transferase CaiB-like acyl-CoA transferase
MTCATCRRLRERLLARARELAAAVGRQRRGPTLEQKIADRERRISRRETLKSLLAGVAIVTGLARTELELVDDEQLTFNGVPIYFDGERDLERALRAAWVGGGKPDYIWIPESQLAEFERYWNV